MCWWFTNRSQELSAETCFVFRRWCCCNVNNLDMYLFNRRLWSLILFTRVILGRRNSLLCIIPDQHKLKIVGLCVLCVCVPTFSCSVVLSCLEQKSRTEIKWACLNSAGRHVHSLHYSLSSLIRLAGDFVCTRVLFIFYMLSKSWTPQRSDWSSCSFYDWRCGQGE